jgi:hypothetical protein
MIRFTTSTNTPVRRIKPKPEHVGIDKQAPESLIKRTRAMMRDAASEKGAELGFMVIRGQITEDEYAACRWFDELHARYLRAIDAKEIKSASLSPGDKAEPPDVFSEVGQKRARGERQTVAEHDSAVLAGRACGSEHWRLFIRAVVLGEPPTSASAWALKIVARALDKHRRLSSKRRRGTSKGRK